MSASRSCVDIDVGVEIDVDSDVDLMIDWAVVCKGVLGFPGEVGALLSPFCSSQSDKTGVET